MLWALLLDFQAWGEVQTLAVLDRRFDNWLPGLNHETLPADQALRVEPGQGREIFSRLLDSCDAVLILAPETGGVLSGLTALAEAHEVPVLGSSSLSAETAGDKTACGRLFRQAGLPTPPTCTASVNLASAAAAELGYPLVIKPTDGAGSEGVCRVNEPSELPGALNALRRVTADDPILLQSLVEGVHASVSLLVAGSRSLALSLNRQWVQPGCPFQYLGIETPLAHPDESLALKLAQSAVALLPGLRGYVGVDLVLSPQGPFLIEINPRLTTSYIALRQVAQANLAQAIWQACRNGRLPANIRLNGQAGIRKDDPATWNLTPA
jgi:predicted ATP-grasp superfamily ATP-dependent carboligase